MTMVMAAVMVISAAVAVVTGGEMVMMGWLWGWDRGRGAHLQQRRRLVILATQEKGHRQVGRDFGVGVQAHHLGILQPRLGELGQHLGQSRGEEQRLPAVAALLQDGAHLWGRPGPAAGSAWRRM